MEIARTPSSARALARALERPLGFVPTMGALHAGHLALVAHARAENVAVAASIFVNPLQFGPADDFARYPRAFEADAAALEAAGVGLLYAPDITAMYPGGFATQVQAGPVGEVFEGARRPGHFSGVATVVMKLLGAIEPATLVLGQKDAQQVAVLQAVVRDLDVATRIVVAPTQREPDGLARSSRNVYLTPNERTAAPSLFRAVTAVAARIAAGERDAARALAAGEPLLETPLRWDYLAIVDPMTFVELAPVRLPALVIAVAFAGTTRLLDNVPVAG